LVGKKKEVTGTLYKKKAQGNQVRVRKNVMGGRENDRRHWPNLQERSAQTDKDQPAP